jgi:hypothetical protein
MEEETAHLMAERKQWETERQKGKSQGQVIPTTYFLQ